VAKTLVSSPSRSTDKPAASGKRIQVRRSGVHGKGVFALQDIAEGETLIETETNRQQMQVEDDVEESGRVVLKNAREGEFEYWADKAVAYKNLEALARKWVLVFDQVPMYKERQRFVTTQEKAAPDPVFAALKTYKPIVTVKEQANMYKWRGKLRDLVAPPTAPPERVIRYADFKKKV
jgi:hypothetical protein